MPMRLVWAAISPALRHDKPRAVSHCRPWWIWLGVTEAWSTLTANLICSSEVMSSYPAWALHDDYDVVEYSSAPRDTRFAGGVHLGASVHSWSGSSPPRSTADDRRPDGIATENALINTLETPLAVAGVWGFFAEVPTI
jgi:hypothetical protein